MNIVIFNGPTLTRSDIVEFKAGFEATAEQVAEHIDIEVLPPAGQGDLYRAVQRSPAIIGLIDGRFDQVDAVAHKEILWAMSQGVHVLGAASMGALRAAELAAFGMRGVGTIYDYFASGILEDDDEVAIAHACADEEHRALSVAMVDIRATLAAAVASQVVSEAMAQALIGIAKSCFYPERSYPVMLARASESGIEADSLIRLREFLSTGRVDAKRRDGLALLSAVRAMTTSAIAPLRVRYHFADTDAWRSICRRAG